MSVNGFFSALGKTGRPEMTAIINLIIFAYNPGPTKLSIMKFYKLILALILLSIFTIGAASAADNSTACDLAAEETDDMMEIEESVQDEVSSSPKNDSGMEVSFVTQDSDGGIYAIDEETDISADTYNQDYFRVKFSEKVTGKLSLYIDSRFMADKKITSKTHYFFVNSKDYNLSAGNHSWQIKYSGDENHTDKTAKGTFTLNDKNRTEISTSFVKQGANGEIYAINENTDMYVNDHDSDYLMVRFSKKVSGKLSLYIDGKLKAEKEITGRTHYMFANSRGYNLSEGNHTWKIRYSGDDTHRREVINGTFTLNPASADFVKKDAKMEVYIVTKDMDGVIYSADAHEDIGADRPDCDFFKVKFPKEVSGRISLYIDNEFMASKEITKKTHYLYVNSKDYNLSVGTHMWEIEYSGDDEYDSSATIGRFTLNLIGKTKAKQSSTLTVKKSQTYKAKQYTKKYTVSLKSNETPIKKVYVYLTVKGKKFKKTYSAKTNDKGKAKFRITGLSKKGDYTAVLRFKGTKNNKPVSNNLTIKITKSKCKIKAKNPSVTIEGDSVNVTRNVSMEGFLDVSEAFDLLNEFRLEKGVWYWNDDNQTKTVLNTNASNRLTVLEWDSLLENVSKTRALEIVEKWGHVRPDGSKAETAYPTKADGYYYGGENIAAGQESCKEVIDDWKEANKLYNEQGHRRNMLSTIPNCVGIAGYKINGTIYWVQAFGRKIDT